MKITTAAAGSAAVIIAFFTIIHSSGSAALQAAAPAQPSPAGSATSAPGGRALLVHVSSLGNSLARAVVVRRPAGTYTQDIVLVTRQTTSSDLAKAIAALMLSRNTRGAHVARELRADITAAANRSKVRSADDKRAERDLARLRSARPVRIDGIGKGRAIAIAPGPVRARGK